MAQKQLNGEEKRFFFSASSVKLNSHFNFLALFGRQAFLRTKRE